MKDYNLDDAIRKIPDFPKPGILYYDITSLLTNPEAFSFCIDAMKELYGRGEIDAVAAVESRGFIFASPLARECGIPLVLVRKKGKLPGETWSREFALEYGSDVIEVHKADVKPGMKVLLVDDLIATGGTLEAAVEMFKEGGAEVTDVFSVIGLPFLGYEAKLPGVKISTLINYDSE